MQRNPRRSPSVSRDRLSRDDFVPRLLHPDSRFYSHGCDHPASESCRDRACRAIHARALRLRGRVPRGRAVPRLASPACAGCRAGGDQRTAPSIPPSSGGGSSRCCWGWSACSQRKSRTSPTGQLSPPTRSTPCPGTLTALLAEAQLAASAATNGASGTPANGGDSNGSGGNGAASNGSVRRSPRSAIPGEEDEEEEEERRRDDEEPQDWQDDVALDEDVELARRPRMRTSGAVSGSSTRPAPARRWRRSGSSRPRAPAEC